MFMAVVVAEFDILCLLLSGDAKRNPKESGFSIEISSPKIQKRSASMGGGEQPKRLSYSLGCRKNNE
jgi:hypothetical protein